MAPGGHGADEPDDEDLAVIGVAAPPAEQALRLGGLALAAGLDGPSARPGRSRRCEPLRHRAQARRARHPAGRRRRRPEADHGAGRGAAAGGRRDRHRPANHPGRGTGGSGRRSPRAPASRGRAEMTPRKVCGLKQPERIEQAAALGAAFVGLVFYRLRRATSIRRAPGRAREPRAGGGVDRGRPGGCQRRRDRGDPTGCAARCPAAARLRDAGAGRRDRPPDRLPG